MAQIDADPRAIAARWPALRFLVSGFAIFLAGAAPVGALSCTGCHGAGGNAMGVLQGRAAADTVAQMEAFRSGARPATLMNRVVRGFSPEEISAIADWFSKQ